MNPTGKPGQDKKKLLLLAGLGLGVIIIYKQVVLKPAPSPEVTNAVAPEVAIPVENAPAATEGMPAKEFTVSESTPEAAKDNSGQSWGRDPFVGVIDEVPGTGSSITNPVKNKPLKEEDLLELTGIAWYKNKALAVINGQVVHEGEYLYIKGKKTYLVISILKNRVLLKNSEKTITLRVRGG